MTRRRRRHVSTVELIAILLILGGSAAILLPALARSREAANRSSCQNNLKQWGLVCKMYAGENKGKWPPLSSEPDNWFPDLQLVYPEYLTDLSICLCPSSPFTTTTTFSSSRMQGSAIDPNCVTSLYYNYTGYMIFSDEQALALYAASRGQWLQLRDGKELTLEVPVWSNSNRVQWPGQSGIPVMWDRVPLVPEEFGHIPAGTNVLHMDGHVQFVKYSHYNNSNYFPATRTAAETFGGSLPRPPGECYNP